jgi:hypothetical protein
MSLKKVETRLLEKLQTELQKPEVMEYIVRETTRRAEKIPSGGKKRDSITREVERERKWLQNLVQSLAEAEPTDPSDDAATAFPTVHRSQEGAAQNWNLSFAVDLPPLLRTGRWRERGGRRR